MASPGTLVGLLLGAGLALIWWSLWPSGASPARRSLGVRRRLDDVLAQAGAESVGPVSLIVVSAGTGLTAGLTAAALSGAVPVAVCVGGMAAGVPWSVIRRRAARRRTELRLLWPDVVDNLASAVRAGLSLPEALAQVGDRGPDPVRPAFTRFAQDYQVTGRFGESLTALKDRLADPVADRIVEAVRMTRDVGGTDFGRLLRTLSAFLRDDLRTRRELEARQSWTVGAARLAVAAPWLVLALLATRPGALDAYNRPTGYAVLGIGAVLCFVAYRVMIAIGRLPEEERILR